MNEKLLVALAVLLKIDVKNLKESIEKEDGSDEVVTNFLKDNSTFTLEDVKKLQTNAVNKKFEELEKGQVSREEIPQKLYEKIGASFLESKEKKIAKEYGIEDFSGVIDLVNKVAEISKASGKGNDNGDGAGDGEKDKQIETLKQTVSKLEQDNKEGIEGAEKKYNDQLISMDSQTAFDAFSKKMDYDDKAAEGETSILAKQIKLLRSAFGNEHGIVRKDDKNIVVRKDKDDAPINDNLGDPKPILTVIEEFAKGHGFNMKEPDAGGRGSGGSAPKGSFKGVTWEKYLTDNSIEPHTDEADKAFVEWKAANKEN